MTPLKAIIWYGLVILAMDHSNQVSIICIAANKEQRDWLCHSLSAFHHVPAREVEGLPIMQYATDEDTE